MSGEEIIRKFGLSRVEARVELDPMPGSIGGDVGGTVDLGFDFDPRDRFWVWLYPIYILNPNRGGRGPTIPWKEGGPVASAQGLLGTRLVFRFALPAELLGSGEHEVTKGEPWETAMVSSVQWRLDIQAVDAEAWLSFEIPVAAVGIPRTSLSRDAVPDTGKDGAEALARNFLYRVPDRDALVLVQPPIDDKAPAMFSFAAGAGCLVAGYFFSWPVVALFGAFVLAVGVLYCGDSSRIVVSASGAERRRSMFGRMFRLRSVGARQAKVGIEVSASTATLTQHPAPPEYTLYVADGAGLRVSLIERIGDSRQANALRRIVARRLDGAADTQAEERLIPLLSEKNP